MPYYKEEVYWLVDCIFFLQLTKSIVPNQPTLVVFNVSYVIADRHSFGESLSMDDCGTVVMMDLTQTLSLFSPRRFWNFLGRWRAHDVFQTTSILLSTSHGLVQGQQTLHETKNITCLFVSSDPRGTNCFEMVRMNIKRYMFSQCFTFQAT